MKVLVLSRYGTRAASTRQRFTLYAPYLAERGVELQLQSLSSNQQVARIGSSGATLSLAVVGAYWRRLLTVLRPGSYDLLWIAYELFPFLPGVFERLVRVSGIPYVIDYDDAVFHNYDAHRSPVVRRLLGRKLAPLLRAASACTCGNMYLKSYAERYCSNAVVVPTVVDTDLYVPPSAPRAEGAPLVVGWIGSPTTWKNVEPLLSTLRPVLEKHKALFQVIGAGPEAAGIEGLTPMEWAEAGEVQQLQELDVGIMPLLDLPFQRGKCGYKLIQYMACGVPVVASPVGVNRDIVESAGSGLLAHTAEDWPRALDRLLGDAVLRRAFGASGRDAAVQRFSLGSQAGKVLHILKSAGTPREAVTGGGVDGY